MNTVEGDREFSLQFLKKYGHLDKEWSAGGIKWKDNWGNEGNISFYVDRRDQDSPHVRLIYKSRKWAEGEWRSMNYTVPLESNPCNFGGQRWFFRCELYKNGKYCGRKVRSLFPAGHYFGCRHCAGLVYYSQTKAGNCRYHCLWKHFDIEEYYEKNVKRKYYDGKPTKKYRTYLKMLMRNNFNVARTDRLFEEMLL